MKTFLLILLLSAFLQSAFLPLNLVLVILIARSLVLEDQENLLLAFFGGLILSFLTQVNLGYYPLVFILIVKLAALLKKLPVSFNLLMILAAGSLLIAFASILDSFFISKPLTIWIHVIEAILVIPSYLIIRFWEGRFIVRSNKLRI